MSKVSVTTLALGEAMSNRTIFIALVGFRSHVSALTRLCSQKRDRLIGIYHVTYPFLTLGYHLVSFLEVSRQSRCSEQRTVATWLSC
jgi:hypothetical protein